MRGKFAVITLLGVLALILFVTPVTRAQGTITCSEDYTVQAGDWLSTIANQKYQDVKAYWAIYTATNLKSETDSSYATIVMPDSIAVGSKLCLPSQSDAQALYNPTPPEGLSNQALQNATFTSELVSGGSAQLTNGTFSQPSAPGSALVTQVRLSNYIAYGELNGMPSAAVVTFSSGGGSGEFYDLHVMQVRDGQVADVASINLGDRSPVLVVTIANNQIFVDFVTQGPNEPMCCGTQRTLNTYTLADNQLTLVSSTVIGQISQPTPSAPAATAQATTALAATQTPAATLAPAVTAAATLVASGTATAEVTATVEMTPTGAAATTTPAATSASGGAPSLTGSVWKWFESSTATERISVARPSLYTVQFNADGTVAVKADCNSGSGKYTVSGTNLTLAPLALTRVACGEASLGNDFVTLLGQAASYSFEGNNLVVALQGGGSIAFIQ